MNDQTTMNDNNISNSVNNNNNNDDPSSFISSLSQPLQSYAAKAFPSQEEETANLMGGAPPNNNNLLDELEISTRSYLLELLEQLMVAESDGQSNAIEQLLQYLKNVTLLCLTISRAHASNPALYPQLSSDGNTNNNHNLILLKKLPFLLLEDTIDSLPLNHIQTLWGGGPSSSYPTLCISSYMTMSLLCSPTLFITPSKFILLRICNKLLKNLSNRDVDSNFAGSIMIMMAKVFPLSERSAVNVLGSFNVVNETVFEDEDEFNNGKLQHAEKEKSGSSGSSNTKDSIGYDFYKTFWGVQKIFTDPQNTILSSSRMGGGGGRPTQKEAANTYNKFVKDITSILVTLEGRTPVAVMAAANSSSSSTKSADSNETVRHHKYLTSSQLLTLQLHDPQLRIHFLTQLLIILSYLSSPSVNLPTGITPTPGADVTKLSNQIRVTQLKQLSIIEKRTCQLLRAHVNQEGDGENMWKFTCWLLKEREVIWRNWKRGKCMPALDKVVVWGGTDDNSSVVRRAMSAIGKKRKATAATSSTKKKAKNNQVIQISNLSGTTMSQITSSLPTLQTFLEPYVEALDPENGIDDEYHPRNDKVYSWRALRLMARDQTNDTGLLNKFDVLRRRDGDFEGIVRTVESEGGDGIGGTLPEDYYAEAPDNEPACADAEDGDKDEDKVDVDMEDDAASVGTNEEDKLAKKEKMEEFERAAMEVEEEMLNEDDEEDKDDGKKDEAANGKEDDTKDKSEAKGEESKGKADDKEKTTEVSAAETNSDGKDENEPKKEEKSEEPKKSEEKKNDDVKEDPKKSEEKKKDDVKEEPRSRRGSKKATNDSAKKDNGSKKDGKSSASSNNGKKQDGNKKDDNNKKGGGRSKFTPPKERSSKNLEPSAGSRGGGGRDRSRGKNDGRRGGNERNNNDRNDQQSSDRDRKDHKRDNSSETSGRNKDHRRDNSTDSGRRNQPQGRDTRPRSPPNNNAGGRGGGGRGGWVPPPGRGGGPGPSGHGGRGRGGGRGGNRR